MKVIELAFRCCAVTDMKRTREFYESIPITGGNRGIGFDIRSLG